MAEPKANISVCFRAQSGQDHFLFQVLNIGRATDELKFVFTDPEAGSAGVYNAKPDRFGQGDLIRLVPEVTYHSDGSLLFKMPSYSKRTSTIYRNPQQPNYRRTPLSEIDRWQGFLLYRVHTYEICKKVEISNPQFLTLDPSWFDGSPFECRLFLGNQHYPTPIASEDILVQRITGFSDQLDLVILLSKIQARGFPMRIGETDQVVWSTANVIELIPHMPSQGTT
jgi:hypothetical protein